DRCAGDRFSGSHRGARSRVAPRARDRRASRRLSDLEVAGGDAALEVAAPGRWDAMLDRAEKRARVVGDARGRACVYAPRVEVAAANLESAAPRERRGSRPWRAACTLERRLNDPEPPVVPAGIELRAYRDAAQETLRAAMNEALASDPFFTLLTPDAFPERHL